MGWKKKTKKTRWHHHLIDKHQRHSNRTEPLNKQPEDGEASERGRFGSGPGRSRLKWRSWRNPAIPAGSSAGDNESRRERRSIRFFHPRSLPRRLPSPIRYKNCSSLPKRGTTLPFPFFCVSWEIFVITARVRFLWVGWGGGQMKLVGQMLYFVLTTGSGQQTLGEEYCDIIQVPSYTNSPFFFWD